MDSKVSYLHTDSATDRFERVKLGRRDRKREVEVLLPGLLLKGQSHLFYGASDTGKSWLAQYASRETVQEGLPVLYFDLENLSDVMEERMLEALAVSQDDVDDHFYYYPSIELTLDKESKTCFAGLLGSFSEPGLIVWDSLLGFLSLAGLKEDASDDFEKWARFYLDHAREQGWTSMVLDHTGHNATHARGSSRKTQAVQVAFKVEKPQSFDRTSSGRQKLTREKDRLAYLPEKIEVSLGGTPFGLKLKYDGQEFLKNYDNRALYLLYKCGPSGTTHGEWKKLCTTGDKGMSARTYDRVRKELVNGDFVEKRGKCYSITKKGERKVI